jgi:uncharacterized membrane protein YbaN (DUF454 family)
VSAPQPQTEPPPAPARARGPRRWAFLTLGFVSLALGVAGVPLPLIPTVPFLVLAVWCFARSSERLERWILEHSHLGPAVQRWREHGVVSLRAKWLATLWLALSTAMAARSGNVALVVTAGVVCACVALFLWTRPSRPPERQGTRCPPPPPASSPGARRA